MDRFLLIFSQQNNKQKKKTEWKENEMKAKNLNDQ